MKISIITVVYNAVATIERTIKSVLKEKKKHDIEYVVIDGLSNDGTLDILNKYASYIDILISEKDKGIYDAFNKGVKVSSGDYILILAADDYLLNNSIQCFTDSIKDGIDVWSGAVVYYKKHNYFYDISKKELEKLKIYCSLRHPASFFKRTSYYEYGLYDEKYKIAGDRDLFLRFYVKGAKFQIENYPIVYFSLCGVSNTNLRSTEYEDYIISINNGMNKVEANKLYLRKYLLKYILKKLVRSCFRKIFIFLNLYTERKELPRQDPIVDNSDLIKLGLK